MSAPPAEETLTFSGFRLEPARRRLTGPDGADIPLQPRIFDLLMLFLSRPGELLTKQQIMDAVWPDVTVDENNLNQAVSALRRMLDDSPASPRLIATVPRRGYQFIAPVSAEGSQTPAPAPPAAASAGSIRALWRRPGLRAAAIGAAIVLTLGLVWGAMRLTAPPPQTSIAVLPFEDLSPAGDQAWLAGGVAEAIMDGLAGLDGLNVAGQLSSAAVAEANADPRAIGRTLGVSYLLTGGVRRDRDRLRISAALVSTQDGYRVWTETYDRAPDDIFAIEDEIAAAVTAALRDRLGGAPATGRAARASDAGTASAEAYEHYLRGRAYLAQSGVPMLNAAVDEFRRAVALDSGFGSAWAAMARAADALEVEDHESAGVWRDVQREAVARARQSAPDRWETTAVSARLLMRERRWAEAARALEEARGGAAPTPVDAADIEGVFLIHTGRPFEALPLFRAARQSDPLSFVMSARLAWALDMTEEPAAALAEYAHARTLPGDDTAWAFQHLVRLLETRYAQDIEAHLAAYPYDEDGASAILRQVAGVWREPDAALAVLGAALNNETIKGPHRLDALALLAAHYGDGDLALALFREEFFIRNGGSTAHLWNPAMRDVRRTEGFKTLVRDLGFAEYWRETGAWPDFCRPASDPPGDDFICQ